MLISPGADVFALRDVDVDRKVVYVYGRGTFIGLRRPPDGTKTPFGVVGTRGVPHWWKNPCIVLEDGNVVWGCQTHWGSVEHVQERFAGYSFEPADVADLENPSLADGELGRDEVKSGGWA